MFDIGGPELIVIVLAFIILFGPKKLPEMVQMFTKGIRQFRQAQAQVKKQFDDISADMQQAANLDSLQELRDEIKEIDPRKAVSYKYQKAQDLSIKNVPDSEEEFTDLQKTKRNRDTGFSVKPPSGESIARGNDTADIPQKKSASEQSSKEKTSEPEAPKEKIEEKKTPDSE